MIDRETYGKMEKHEDMSDKIHTCLPMLIAALAKEEDMGERFIMGFHITELIRGLQEPDIINADKLDSMYNHTLQLMEDMQNGGN